MAGSSERVAVFGDTGGQTSALWNALIDLGFAGDITAGLHGVGWALVDIDVPRDLHIVHLGDLVHRGPDSLGAVLLVDRLIAHGVWTQVTGNHEQLYVDRPIFQWAERIPPIAAERLRAWWAEGSMVAGAVVEAEQGALLATHAGVTAGFWQHVLGGPDTAAEFLSALHEARSDGALWHPGVMLTGRPDYAAGPVWASAAAEVCPSWLDAEVSLPFSQVHGHSTSYDWEARKWHASRRVRASSVHDAARRHVTFTHGAHSITGIDPGHGTAPAPVYAPLIIENATTLV